MAGSRRKFKRGKPKVRVALPKKKPGVFKPAVDIPAALAGEAAAWDNKGSVLENYRAFGVVANPNILGVRSRTPHIVQSSDLQIPSREFRPVSEFDDIDGGSDLETDDVKSAIGKRRRDGKAAPMQPLTTVQRVHVGRLIKKYGDDYQAMFMDIKLNTMQHSVAALQKLCKRFDVGDRKNYILS